MFIMINTLFQLKSLALEEIEKYLPPLVPQMRLDVDNPMTLGPVGIPQIYTEIQQQLVFFILSIKYYTQIQKHV